MTKSVNFFFCFLLFSTAGADSHSLSYEVFLLIQLKKNKNCIGAIKLLNYNLLQIKWTKLHNLCQCIHISNYYWRLTIRDYTSAANVHKIQSKYCLLLLWEEFIFILFHFLIFALITVFLTEVVIIAIKIFLCFFLYSFIKKKCERRKKKHTDNYQFRRPESWCEVYLTNTQLIYSKKKKKKIL